MDWKEAGKRFFQKNQKEEQIKQESTVPEEENFEEPIKDDGEFNPRESDTKDKNRKVVFILSIALIIFGLFIYVASKSRQKPQVVEKKEESYDLTGMPEEEVEESANIYEIKKELNEIKQKLEKENNNRGGIPEKELFQVGNKKNNESKVSNSNQTTRLVDTSVSPNPVVNQDYQTKQETYKTNNNNREKNSRIIFPDQPIAEEKPKKYIVKVVEDPFQGKTFASLYTDVGFQTKSNENNTNIIKQAVLDKPVMGRKKKSDSEKNKSNTKTESKGSLPKQEFGTTKFTIPAGSFFKVILLNGVDAPTGMKGKSTPYPVVARVLTNSVLPNRFFADMKGCFVLGEAVGELYNERAIIRFTKISCVTKKGKVIQKDILGALSGEDGKVGLSGRVVSKSGAILARTLLAKFAESAGNIFSLQAQIISTSGVGTVSTIKPSEAGKAAVYSGLAGAAKTLSEYYLELADQTFPVVEINAGRQGDVILLKSLVIDVKNDFKDNGSFIQRTGVLVSDSPEEKVFKVEEN